jgi:N-acetylmuramic acid 6-phosphate etherase
MQQNSTKSTDSGVVDAAFALALLANQKTAIAAVEAVMPAICAAAGAMAEALSAGGRVIYTGAGSSGLIALQDGAELPGTFGLHQFQVAYAIAGGAANSPRIEASAEDDQGAARRDMTALAPRSRDIVIAVSASGSTPYTLACARAGTASGAKLIALTNRQNAPLLAMADFPILLDSGPEALHGSTRLAAGTAQKAALGILSTLANAALGHVWRGHMVNVRPENEKLRRRAAHIVATLTGVDEDHASACLVLASDDVKCAILIASGAPSRGVALDLVDRAHGHLSVAISYLRDCA